ncbi:MAG: exodeoxyribonuclease VII small subunit [Candidatus Nomurabacteria bacterium]|nr:MAG: exodeoxyribonuclease VII small subunit [Candidatus Nomurabacteria bacterium]
MTTKRSQKKISFQSSFQELQKITDRFESSDLDLDEAMQLFERGLTLAKELKKRLGEMENTVKQMKKKVDQE